MQLSGNVRYQFIYGSLGRYHHYYELMCRKTPNYVQADFSHLWYYNREITRRSYEELSLTGLEIFVYEPLRSDQIFRNPVVDLSHTAPVLAFLGTRIEQLSDLRTDLNKVGVGLDRYFKIEAIIRRIILDLHDRFGKVVITGFSLGGCLAQYTAMRHTAYVQELVTFQSPKIPKYFQTLLRSPQVYNLTNEQVKNLLNSNTFHYQVAEDTIPGGADIWNINASHTSFTPGLVITFNYGSLSRSGIDEHTIRIFKYFTGANLRERRAKASVSLRDCQAFIRTSRPRILSITIEKTNRTRYQYPGSVALFEDDLMRSFFPNYISLITQGRDILREALVAFFTPDRIEYIIIIIWNRYSLQLIQNPPGSADHRSILNRLLNFREAIFFRGDVQGLLDLRNLLPEEVKEDLRNRIRLFTYKITLPEPQGRIVYIDIEGRLTDQGLQRLRSAEPQEHTRRFLNDPHNEQTVREIFEGVHNSSGNDYIQINGRKIYHNRLQFRWREMLIKEEIIQSRRLERFENHIYRTSRNVPNRNTLYMIEGISLGNILNAIPRIIQDFAHRLRNSSEIVLSFNFRVRLPDSSDFTDKNIQNLKVYEFLSYLIRDDITVQVNNEAYQDEELVYAYFMAHQFYIGCIKKDPLKLLVNQRRQNLCGGDINRRTGQEFTDQFDLTEFKQRAADAARTYPSSRDLDDQALKHLQNLKIAEWYNFLFEGAESGNSNRGHKFIAESHVEEDDSISRTDLPLRMSQLVNSKELMDKIPDIILIFPERKLVEVIDPTFRYNVPWHNFKTAIYVAVFRFIFPNDWSFRGLDHRDARRSRFV